MVGQTVTDRKLLLTDGVLNTLGFGDYHDGAGDFGRRSLMLKSGSLELMEHDESEYGCHPYETEYQANHYSFEFNEVYFLHELLIMMYGIKDKHFIEEFSQLCVTKHMQNYLYYDTNNDL